MAETVRVDFSELLAVTDELTRNARDVPRLMNIIAEALVSGVQENFRQEGAVGGHPKWPPLAASTIAKRRGSAKVHEARQGRLRRAGEKRIAAGKAVSKAQRNAMAGGGGTFKILQDRGILAGSITPDTGDSSGQIYAEAYTNVPYAVFHVSPEPRTIIPLRDFFAIDEEHFAAEATEIVLASLTRRSGR